MSAGLASCHGNRSTCITHDTSQEVGSHKRWISCMVVATTINMTAVDCVAALCTLHSTLCTLAGPQLTFRQPEEHPCELSRSSSPKRQREHCHTATCIAKQQSQAAHVPTVGLLAHRTTFLLESESHTQCAHMDNQPMELS